MESRWSVLCITFKPQVSLPAIISAGTLLLDPGLANLPEATTIRATAAREAAAAAADTAGKAAEALAAASAAIDPSSEQISQLAEELQLYQVQQEGHDQEQQRCEALLGSLTGSLCLLRASGGTASCTAVSEAAGQVLTLGCPAEKMPSGDQEELLKALEGFWLSPGSVRVVGVMEVAQQLVGMWARMTPLQVIRGCVGAKEGKDAGQ